MRICALIDKKALTMPSNVVVNVLWGLEMNIIIVSHESSVVRNRVIA
jgi:hypothetical protein